MATFTKRNGRWRVQIRKKDYNKAATFTTKREAQAWAAKIEAEYQLGRAGRMGEVKTVGDALERYRDEISIGKPSERWQFNKVRHLSEFTLYHVYLKDLTSTHLAEFRDLRLSQVKPGTVIKELGFISGVLSQCVKEWRWLSHNPMVDVRYPKAPKPRERRISEEEITTMCEGLGLVDDMEITTYMQQVAVAFLLAIETAMRKGEILSLEWEQVHLNKRYVQLIKTKNGDERKVALSSRAVELIERMRGQSQRRVFTVPSGTADAIFRKIRKRMGLEGFTFHDSRREGTSRLAKKLDVMDLAKQTGHRDVKMLLNTYYQPDISDIALLLG